MSTKTAHQVTLRLPKTLYRDVKRVAAQRRLSINRLAQQELERLVREAEDAEMAAAYEALSEDEESAEQYFAAQREVIERAE